MGSLSAFHHHNANALPSNDTFTAVSTTPTADQSQQRQQQQQQNNGKPQASSLSKTSSRRNNKNMKSINHRRIQTGDSTLFLPPASILNMSLTGKEFKELIDNTIDTSSIGGGDVGYYNTVANGTTTLNAPLIQAGDRPPVNDHNHSPNHRNRIPRPHKISQPSTSTATAASTTTRHHRRLSSSRFLLNEWAMESNVRDLYGASPPADLPHEITLLAEQHQQQKQYRQSPRHVPVAAGRLDQDHQTMGSPPTRWSPRRIFGRSNNTDKNWMLSPFSLDGHDKHNGRPNNRLSQEQRYEPSLNQPLLPSLQCNNSSGDNDNDEELGGPLLGEAFVPSTSDSAHRKT